jgi:hypothetical protein
MKLWTQGSRIFVLDGNGLSTRDKDVVIQVSTLGLSHGFVRGKLAVSPDGQYVAFGPDDGRVNLWDSARNDTVELAHIENLIWLSNTRVLAVVKDRGLGLCEFNPQRVGSDYLRQRRIIDARIVRPVEWPTPDRLSSVWRNLPAPAVRQKSAWELSVGPYGAAAVNQVTGLLVLLSPDSLDVCAVLSVPAEYPETVIYVTALHNAFAVTHTGGRSTGGTNVFDYEGKWIAGVVTHGLPSPVGVLSEDVLIQLVEESQFNSSLILRMLNNKTLNVLRTAPTELDALNGYPTLHVGKSRIAIGDGRSYHVIELTSLETP